MFIFNGVIFGLALGMDAFSVSVANGINESGMSRKKSMAIPMTFAIFQFIMPLAGWFLVTVMKELIEDFQFFIPYIALILLSFIGGKMLISGIKELWKGRDDLEEEIILNPSGLMIQGIATSIDALSVGFTISDYNAVSAVALSLIIALVTFILCVIGLFFGKKIGNAFSEGDGILGGIILIAIGIKIFLQGI